MTVVVRPVRGDELERVSDLVVQAYVADGLVSEDHQYVPELRDAAKRSAEALVLVAVEGRDVLGTVTLAMAGTRYAEVALPGEAEVRMLAVDAGARGRGIGEMLVRAVIREGLDGGASAVILSTMPTMRTAHRMYDRLGLRRDPERDWPIAGQTMLVYRTAGRPRPLGASAR